MTENQDYCFDDDVIAGIATAVSEAGIGIIRVSGRHCDQMIDGIFRPGDRRGSLQASPANLLHYGFIEDGKETVDEVLVSVMRAPHSFTAEDTVEINCHGGVYAVRRVLDLVVGRGARLALPGEFTQRAFLNGRIGLSQAEAVMDVIQAKNELALKSSMGQLQGSLQQKISALRGQILHELAFIEAALDDPEHYSTQGYAEVLDEKVKSWMEDINALIASSQRGALIREGIRTAIIGKPNVGKSSLLNALMGQERAIVTDQAGTTRDVLTETLRIGQVVLTLTDTAGIHRTEDTVEKIGVKRACESAKNADLVLFVIDSSQKTDWEDEQILQLIRDKKIIALLNKSDLSPVTTADSLRRILPEQAIVLQVSALTGRGMQLLGETIEELFYKGGISFNDQLVVTNARHRQLLEETKEALCHVEEALLLSMPEDFISIDLTQACSCLGGITGDEVREDLVREIFSKFCMGK